VVNVVGGLAGTANPGISACRMLAKRLPDLLTKGRVRIVPVVDVAGFYQRAARFCPLDGRAVARAFAAAETAEEPSASDRIAQAVSEALADADVSIDVRGGELTELHAHWVAVPPAASQFESLAMAVASGADMRVAVDPAQPCLRCDLCLQGHPNLCRRLHFCGLWPDDGALCERMLVPAHGCFPLPDALSDAEGALLEPLGVALHAVDLARLRLARSVAVLGCGPIGLLILAVARAYGAGAVYCTDLNQGRLDLARQLGATAAVNVGGLDLAEILDATDRLGADVSFEAVGTPGTLETAMRLVRPGGTVVAVGVNIAERIPFNLMLSQSKEATLVPVYLGRHAFPETIDLLGSGRIDGELLISHRFPLERAAEAMETSLDANTGAVKVMIRPGADGGEPA